MEITWLGVEGESAVSIGSYGHFIPTFLFTETGSSVDICPSRQAPFAKQLVSVEKLWLPFESLSSEEKRVSTWHVRKA